MFVFPIQNCSVQLKVFFACHVVVSSVGALLSSKKPAAASASFHPGAVLFFVPSSSSSSLMVFPCRYHYHQPSSSNSADGDNDGTTAVQYSVRWNNTSSAVTTAKTAPGSSYQSGIVRAAMLDCTFRAGCFSANDNDKRQTDFAKYKPRRRPKENRFPQRNRRSSDLAVRRRHLRHHNKVLNSEKTLRRRPCCCLGIPRLTFVTEPEKTRNIPQHYGSFLCPALISIK